MHRTVSADLSPKDCGCTLSVKLSAVEAAVAGIGSQIRSVAEHMDCSYQRQSAAVESSVAGADTVAAAGGIGTGRIPFAEVGSRSDILSVGFEIQ